MSLDCFDLHEDEWGMIDLIPVENHAHAQSVVDEATAHADAHRAPDGLGYTDVYVAPEPLVPLSLRAVSLSTLASLLGAPWQRIPRVTSGYSSYREDLPNAYAYSDGNHVLYGSHREGLVTTLHLHPGPPNEALIDLLHALGQGLRLIVQDLWRDQVVDLRSRQATAEYVRGL
ncbi:MAG: hypothetical protein JNJ46_29100 [Myxococcales bacterium]|nr:hypothetical protein [Myxococcales bacterium]